MQRKYLDNYLISLNCHPAVANPDKLPKILSSEENREATKIYLSFHLL